MTTNQTQHVRARSLTGSSEHIMSSTKSSRLNWRFQFSCRWISLYTFGHLKRPFQYAKYKKKCKINNEKQLLEYLKNNIKDKKADKKARCPNGTRRNKSNGLCEPIIKNKLAKNKENISINNKKPNCPKGTRRNKKTGLCEPK